MEIGHVGYMYGKFGEFSHSRLEDNSINRKRVMSVPLKTATALDNASDVYMVARGVPLEPEPVKNRLMLLVGWTWTFTENLVNWKKVQPFRSSNDVKGPTHIHMLFYKLRLCCNYVIISL